MSETPRAAAHAIWRAALAAGNVAPLVERALDRLSVDPTHPSWRRLFVFGCGKASGAMAAALERVLGRRITEGLVVVKDGYTVPTHRTVEKSRVATSAVATTQPRQPLRSHPAPSAAQDPTPQRHEQRACRPLIIRDYDAAFERFDLLVSPTSPTTAFPIGAKVDDPMAMYLNDIFTIPANLSGMPAISIPCGLDEAGLPVGLQLTAPVLGERTLLRAASALEGDLGLRLGPPTLELA